MHKKFEDENKKYMDIAKNPQMKHWSNVYHEFIDIKNAQTIQRDTGLEKIL